MSNQYRSSYVPAIVEDVLPPPPAPHPEPPLTREGVRAETMAIARGWKLEPEQEGRRD